MLLVVGGHCIQLHVARKRQLVPSGQLLVLGLKDRQSSVMLQIFDVRDQLHEP